MGSCNFRPALHPCSLVGACSQLSSHVGLLSFPYTYQFFSCFRAFTLTFPEPKKIFLTASNCTSAMASPPTQLLFILQALLKSFPQWSLPQRPRLASPILSPQIIHAWNLLPTMYPMNVCLPHQTVSSRKAGAVFVLFNTACPVPSTEPSTPVAGEWNWQHPPRIQRISW